MTPTIGLALPARADRSSVQVLESSKPILNVVPTDFGVGITSAIPPAGMRITFAYRVSGLIGSYDLSRTVLYRTSDVSVYAVEPFSVSSNRLVESKSQRIGGDTYRVWSSADRVEAGDAVQIRATAEAGAESGVVGAIAADTLAAVLGLFAVIRLTVKRRGMRVRERSRGTPERRVSTRDELVAAIAELDVRYRGGEVAEEDWRKQRAELKSHLPAIRNP